MKIQFYAALILVLLVGVASNCKAQTPLELQCIARGWQRVVLPVAGLQRVLLWKAGQLVPGSATNYLVTRRSIPDELLSSIAHFRFDLHDNFYRT